MRGVGYMEEKLKFGSFKVPLKISDKNVKISVKVKKSGLVYHREAMGENVDKMLLASTGKIIINPVEPINTPKQITSTTSHLSIETLSPKNHH